MNQSDDRTNGPTGGSTDDQSLAIRDDDAGALTESKIADHEVDDIIGIATEIAEEDKQRQAQLDVGDVVEIGEELGLDGHHVEQAVDELRDRQQRDVESRARRKKLLLIIGASAAALLALLLILGLSGRSSLRALAATVTEKRAQLDNVLDRQRQVEKRYEDKAATPERDAELAGATNRVAIERRRYDKAANRYNTEAGSLTGSLGTLFFGMPDKVPLSNELIKR